MLIFLHRLAPAVKALLAQLGGLGLAAAGLSLQVLPTPLLLSALLTQALGACLCALLLRSARWWLAIHLLFMPAIVLALQLKISPWWYLAGFALLLSIYWTSFRTQVPLYLSNTTTARAVGELLTQTQAKTMLDIGCGTGSLLAKLAPLHPALRCHGIELAPLPWLIARLRCRGLSNVEIRRGDFFSGNWGEYDAIYAFLSPAPMERVWRKARQEMRPGSLLISNSFPVPDVEPDRVLTLGDRRMTRLFLYRMPVATRHGRTAN